MHEKGIRHSEIFASSFHLVTDWLWAATLSFTLAAEGQKKRIYFPSPVFMLASYDRL
jgi:hypothetical protein